MNNIPEKLRSYLDFSSKLIQLTFVKVALLALNALLLRSIEILIESVSVSVVSSSLTGLTSLNFFFLLLPFILFVSELYLSRVGSLRSGIGVSCGVSGKLNEFDGGLPDCASDVRESFEFGGICIAFLAGLSRSLRFSFVRVWVLPMLQSSSLGKRGNYIS